MLDENHSSRNDLEIEQRISPDFNTNKPGKHEGGNIMCRPRSTSSFGNVKGTLLLIPFRPLRKANGIALNKTIVSCLAYPNLLPSRDSADFDDAFLHCFFREQEFLELFCRRIKERYMFKRT